MNTKDLTRSGTLSLSCLLLATTALHAEEGGSGRCPDRRRHGSSDRLIGWLGRHRFYAVDVESENQQVLEYQLQGGNLRADWGLRSRSL